MDWTSELPKRDSERHTVSLTKETTDELDDLREIAGGGRTRAEVVKALITAALKAERSKAP